MADGAEIREQLAQVLTAVRLVKQRIPQFSPVPAAMASVLGAIDSHDSGGCHVKDLAARNVLDPSTVSRSVAALVRQGLVRRSADPLDGRASVLELTDAGRAALRDVHQRFDAVLADALDGWDPRDLAVFAALLQRFAGDLLAGLGQSPSPEPLPTLLEAAR